MQCSPGKPSVLVHMCVPLWHTAPTQTPLQTRYTPSRQQHSLMAEGPLAGKCSLAIGRWHGAQGVLYLASKFLCSQSDGSSVGSAATSQTHGGPPRHPHDSKNLPPIHWCQTPHDTVRGPVSMPQRVRVVLATQGGPSPHQGGGFNGVADRCTSACIFVADITLVGKSKKKQEEETVCLPGVDIKISAAPTFSTKHKQ